MERVGAKVARWIPNSLKRSSSRDPYKLDTDLALLKKEADRAEIDEKAFRRLKETDPLSFAQNYSGNWVSLCDAARTAAELVDLPIFKEKERYQAPLARLVRTLLEIAEIKRSWSPEKVPESTLTEIKDTIQRSLQQLPAVDTGCQFALRSEWNFCTKSLDRLLTRSAEDSRLRRLDSVLSGTTPLVTEWDKIATALTGDVYYDTFLLSWLGRLSREHPNFFKAKLGPILRERQTQEEYLAQIEIMVDLAERGCDELQQQAFDGPYELVGLAGSQKVHWLSRAITLFHLKSLLDHPIPAVAEMARKGLEGIREKETDARLKRYLAPLKLDPPSAPPTPLLRRPLGGSPRPANSGPSPFDPMNPESLSQKEGRLCQVEQNLNAEFSRAFSDLLRQLTELKAEMSEVSRDLHRLTSVPFDKLSERDILNRDGLRAELMRLQQEMVTVTGEMGRLLEKEQQEQAKLRAERTPHSRSVLEYIRNTHATPIEPQYIQISALGDAW